MEDATSMADGTAYIVHEEISASQLITMGLDFEDQQYAHSPIHIILLYSLLLRRRLTVDTSALGMHATDDQRTRIQVRANTLRRKVTAWVDIQHLYIPMLRVIRAHAAVDIPAGERDEPAHMIALHLPSSITPHSRVICDIRLCQMEWDLRFAQANDALDELRDGLRLRSYLYIDKDRFQRGQRRNTRSRGVIDRTEVKIRAAAAKYRAAREALKGLTVRLSYVGWDQTFPVLLATDIRGLSDAEESRAANESGTSAVTGGGTHSNGGRGRGRGRGGSRRARGNSRSTVAGARPSEGRRTLSWIWLNLGELEEGDELLQDGMSDYFS